MDTANHLVFDPSYKTDLPAYGLANPFALDRGEMVLRRLELDFGEAPVYTKPVPLTRSQARIIHSDAYLQSLDLSDTWARIFEIKDAGLDKNGCLPGACKPLHLILDDILLKSGGTLEAAKLALRHGMCANLGGGYHHAFPDRGHGYCAVNDVAVTIATLLAEGLVARPLIVDVDFHQGDGTAVCFADDPRVFTLSIHSQEGWPDVKQKSTLDVEIGESEKETYLPRLKEALDLALERHNPDYVLLVDGSDAYEKDVLPGTSFLRLPLAVLQERGRHIVDTCANAQIPLSLVFAGGYGPDVWEVHYATVRRLLERCESYGTTGGVKAYV